MANPYIIDALRRRARNLVSLDAPEEQDALDVGADFAIGFTPVLSQIQALRDFERARRADDSAGMAMSAASFIPFGKLIGALRKTDPVMREITVYHGTPHRYAPTENNPLGEFDASKIGSGEGAQAYGHGIYFAENPGVARSYIATPKDWAAQANVKGSAYRNAQAEMTKVERELRQKHSEDIPKKEISAFMYAEQNPEKFDPKLIERIRAIRQAEEKAYKDFSTGSFYKADLPDEMIDRMLDWDKPLTQQSTYVKTALKNSGLDPSGLVLSSGKNLIEKDLPLLFAPKMRAAGFDPNKSADVSAFLQAAGIPGIKYADAGSRGQGGSGTRNFVVFPDEEKNVRILGRE